MDMNDAQLKKTLDAIPNIPTLPAIALKVNTMLMDTNSSMRELSDLIINDQAIVSSLLRLVNSPFYGFGSQIDSAHRAITILGSETMRNAIIAVSVIPAFSETELGPGFSLSAFWRHSIAVAVVSRYLGRQLATKLPEACFTAGLLHDIGKIIIARYFSDKSAVIRELKNQGLRGFEAERKALSTDHAAIGGYLAKKWRLPDILVNAISLHHAPHENKERMNLAALVHAADWIVNHSMLDGVHRMPPEVAAANSPGLTQLIETAPSWYEQIESDIDHACAFFDIE